MWLTPIFADAINFGIVLTYGIAILVPLLVFQVAVESLILSKLWHIPFRGLMHFSLNANGLSLLAGIPTKIVNGVIYGLLLPWDDIPSFFARYPWAVALGTLMYFVVTLGAEWLYARKWTRQHHNDIARNAVFRGILWANIATYFVLAPLHYLGTRPVNDIKEFSNHVRWTKSPEMRVVYINPATGLLQTRRIAESSAETLVPKKVKSYLVSADLETCLYRDSEGSLHIWQRRTGMSKCIWPTSEHTDLNEIAFSPSGERVALLRGGASITVVETQSQKSVEGSVGRIAGRLTRIAWSTHEDEFVVAAGTNEYFVVRLLADSFNRIANTNQPPPLLPCYGRMSRYIPEKCGDLKAWVVPGLGSHLRIYRENAPRDQPLLRVAVNPGLLHLAATTFSEVVFLPTCNECLVQATDGLYLIDIDKKRLGRIAAAAESIAFLPQYRKQL